jgi:hypothetical protein
MSDCTICAADRCDEALNTEVNCYEQQLTDPFSLEILGRISFSILCRVLAIAELHLL